MRLLTRWIRPAPPREAPNPPPRPEPPRRVQRTSSRQPILDPDIRQLALERAEYHAEVVNQCDRELKACKDAVIRLKADRDKHQRLAKDSAALIFKSAAYHDLGRGDGSMTFKVT